MVETKGKREHQAPGQVRMGAIGRVWTKATHWPVKEAAEPMLAAALRSAPEKNKQQTYSEPSQMKMNLIIKIKKIVVL
ncbi:MAG: hypothetical protein ACKO6N_28630 [Myxococcota bacterium]